MSRSSLICELPGGAALCDWFGGVPIFHDAELHEADFTPGRPCRLVLYTFRITREVDSRGVFKTDRNVAVTLICEEISDVRVSSFEVALPAILLYLVVSREEAGLRVAWQSAYGVDGDLLAKRVRVDHRPSEPAGILR